MSTNPIRVRRKTTPTADDPDWIGNGTDPRELRITVASAEAGPFSVTLTPEDTTVAAATVSFTNTAENDTNTAAGLATAANTAAATAPGNNFLRATSINAAGVLILHLEPGAPQFVPSVSAPGSATLTMDHAGTMPICPKADGEGSLELSVVAVDSSGTPLAPGSGTVNVTLLAEVDRTQPRGRGGPQNSTAEPAWEEVSTRSLALGTPWTVSEPNGRYTVRIDSDASLPGSTDALEVWAREVPEIVTEPSANSVDSDQVIDGAVDPVHLASGYRTVASDAALALAATDRTVLLLESTTGTKAATMTATHAGHRVDLRLVARSGGSYTMAVSGGTVTLDAANEAVSIVYDGSAWQLLALNGATFA